jgi:zinc transport system substrate-binding protein
MCMHYLRRAGLAALLGLFSLSAAQASDPRVVVSLPPLHSLTAKLLKGVATPELLMTKAVAERFADLSPGQFKMLQRADLIIWSGPELEGAISEAGPLVADFGKRTLTLSHYVPILTLGRADAPDLSSGRRDLRFWLDPRLAHVAIHTIAPALVRLYPLASDTILDNEIAVMAELHHLEHGIRSSLGTTDGVPLHLGTGDLRYLEWRFNLSRSNCPRAGFDPNGFGLASGPALYDRLMDGARDALTACQRNKVAQAKAGAKP